MAAPTIALCGWTRPQSQGSAQGSGTVTGCYGLRVMNCYDSDYDILKKAQLKCNKHMTYVKCNHSGIKEASHCWHGTLAAVFGALLRPPPPPREARLPKQVCSQLLPNKRGKGTRNPKSAALQRHPAPTTQAAPGGLLLMEQSADAFGACRIDGQDSA